VSTDDARLSFAQALAFVRESGQCAFAAVPVFGEDGESAEGARLFILEHHAGDSPRVRFLAGPFFSAALAADEVFEGEQIPERVRELQFLPSSCREEWFSDPIQELIAKLVRASPASTTQMPDYLGAPARRAAPEVSFPVSQIGRPAARKVDP